MALIVQKYGGSSLADSEAIVGVARRIGETHDAGHRVVAVVSAMGDTTDELIELAHRVSERPDPRELDMLLSTGELVSCTLTAMALEAQGRDAVSLSGAQAGIRTDTTHGRARIAAVDADRIMRELDRGRIVVVAGFQGATDGMDVTTLGRGASDLSAVALAASLSADRCEIYTDVAGIYTADPRHVPDARHMAEIGYEEMLELASYGAKMNPRSIEFGMVYEVPIVVASSFERAPGNADTPRSRHEQRSRRDQEQGAWHSDRRQRRQDQRARAVRHAGRPGAALRAACRGRHQRRRHRAERQRRRRDRPDLYRHSHRPAEGDGGGRGALRRARHP